MTRENTLLIQLRAGCLQFKLIKHICFQFFTRAVNIWAGTNYFKCIGFYWSTLMLIGRRQNKFLLVNCS